MTEPLYRIGEAARLLELETYVLRFWESEFPQLEPLRTPKGQRLYTAAHLELLQRVKGLLYEEGMTIEGARKVLARDSQEDGTEAPSAPAAPATAPTVLLPGADASPAPRVVRTKPARLVQGFLLPPTPLKDNASRRLLAELRTELLELRELVRTVPQSTPPENQP